MWTFARQSAAALSLVILLPAAAFAQAAITGVVKDASGAVLPGVTVEAASPALIERARSVVTDDTGQFRIVDLRPGTYTVTFTLTGFSTVRREGIALSGDFVATVNGDLKVGTLEETITVTGESPIVDVQSVKVQKIIDREIIAAIPSSRNASGIQALIPGLSSGGDSGGITGGTGGSAGNIHGGRASDSRTLHDGINTGWAGANSNAAISNVAGSQEVALTTSGGLGEAETGGVVLNVIPRDGGNTFSGTFFMSGANGAMQGSNYTDALKAAGLQVAAGAQKGRRVQSDGRRPHHPGQAVVLSDLPRAHGRKYRARNVRQQERRRSNEVARRSRHVASGLQRQHRPERRRARHVAGLAAQQAQHAALGAVQPPQRGWWRRRDAHAGGEWTDPLYTRSHSGRHVDLALYEPDALRGWLGRLPGALRQLSAAPGRHTHRRADLGARTVLGRMSQQRRHREPGVPSGCTARRWLPTPSDRHDRADTRIRLIHPRRAQPEDRIPRQPQPPEPGVLQPHPIHSVPIQQWQCPTGWTRRLSSQAR